MAYFNKIGLLLLNSDHSKFLVCEKDNKALDIIMPGADAITGEDDIGCLEREIEEELGIEMDIASLKFIKKYIDVAAGDPTKDVSMMLYEGKVIGEPKTSAKIRRFYWIGKDDLTNERLSPIIKNKILPDVIEREILK